MEDVKDFVKRKFNVEGLKKDIKNFQHQRTDDTVYVSDIISGSHGSYVGHVLCEFLELTPKDLVLEEYVSKSEENSTTVDYVGLAQEHGLTADYFQPFETHYERIESINKELTKQLGKTVCIDVYETDNSVGIFIVT